MELSKTFSSLKSHSRFRGSSLSIAIVLSLLVSALGHSNTCLADLEWETNLKDAVKLARKKDVPMMVTFDAEWSTLSKKMKKTTFLDRRVGGVIQDSFVLVELDADKNRDIVDALGVISLPTVIILSADIEVLDRIRGWKKPKTFLSLIDDYIIDPEEAKEIDVDIANDELKATFIKSTLKAPHQTQKQKEGIDTREIPWQNDIKACALLADKYSHPIMIRFTADWCSYCKKMKNDTFSDPDVIYEVNSTFVPVVIDVEEDPSVMNALGVKALPSTVILSPDLETLKVIQGYKDVETFQALINPYLEKNRSYKNRVKPKPVVVKKKTVAPEVKPEMTPVAPQQNSSIAFNGTCIVSVVRDAKVTAGTSFYATEYRGHTLWFASEEHLQAFEETPISFWPENDGMCPVTALDSDKATLGQAPFAVRFQGKIHFCADRDAAMTFLKSPAKYVGFVAGPKTISQARLNALDETVLR